MKKTVLMLMVLGLSAAACAPRGGRGQSFEMTPIAEMATGTLKLEGTADAVTSQQAAELLPMWEVYKQLESSDTAAPQEIDGLTQQIQATMTDAQRQSIKAMKLSASDMFSMMQTAPGGSGGPLAGPGGTRNGTGSARPGTTGPAGGGNFFVGGPPGAEGFGGGFGGGGTGTGTGNSAGTSSTNRGTQNGSTAQGATQQLTRQARARVPTPLINAVIAYLKTKAGPPAVSTPTP